VRYVLEHQHADGMLVSNNRGGPMYCHGISTLMLAEVVGMIPDAALAERVQRALSRAVDVIITTAPPSVCSPWPSCMATCRSISAESIVGGWSKSEKLFPEREHPARVVRLSWCKRRAERRVDIVQYALDRYHKTGRGYDERRVLDIEFGLPRCEAFRRTFDESAADLSPALLTPGPFRTSLWSEKARCRKPPGLVVSMGR
jgi:hypothetical protein